MEATELLLVAIRWLHALAAVVWIGGVLFELVALGPSFGEALPATTRTTLDEMMREIVQTGLIVFLISGAILTFERLSHRAVGSTYVALLAVKILLSVAMFQVAFRFRRATGDRRVLGLRWVAGFGLAILFLASLLKSIYERALVA